jgi:hypothetical protein
MPEPKSLGPYRKLSKLLTIQAPGAEPAEIIKRTRRRKAESSMPDEYKRLADSIGEGNAYIVFKWNQKGIFLDSSTEVLVYDWLDRNAVPFQAQVNVMGGRIENGAVVDFALFHQAEGVMVWRVQGGYWHGSNESQSSDKSEKVRLMSATIDGQPIVDVIDLREADVVHSRMMLLPDALLGIEWGSRK